MIFSLFNRLRYFNKRSGARGQIAPFLIIIIVVFLVAAMVTVNMGKTALIRTYTANGADSGALAGASAMGAALNGLAAANETMAANSSAYGMAEDDRYESIETYYDEIYLWIVAAAAVGVIIAVTGEILAMEGSDSCNSHYGWEAFLMSAEAYAGYYCMQEAADLLYELTLDIGLWKQLVDSHHQGMYDFFCQIVDNMNEAHASAVEGAENMAESNSGKDRFDPDRVGIYTVQVSSSVPAISNYDLQHTADPYSEIKEELDDAYNWANKLTNVAGAMATGFLAAFYIWLAGGILMAAGDIICNCGYEWIGEPIWYIGWLLVFGSWVWWLWAVYAVIILIEAVWLPFLKSKLDSAYEGLQPDDTIAGVSTCAEVADQILIQITNVDIDERVSVTVTANHSGSQDFGLWSVSYPTVRSSATASFSGGDVGSYSTGYSARLVGVF